MNKINTVQDLRGFAILYVVLFHVGDILNLDTFKYGSSGVVLFFIISGFIISINHKSDKGFSAAKLFIKKRIARIYPPYVIALLIVIILFFLSGKGSYYQRDTLNIIKNIFLVQLPSQSIHPYAWSLVYELYYYVSFCLFVIILRLNILVYAAIMAAPYFIGSFYGQADTDTDTDTVPFAFANLYFCLGSVAGIFHHYLRIQFGYRTVLMALLIFLIVPFLNLGSYMLLFATLALFLIYLKSTSSFTILKILGNTSYSIYLTHAIVLMMLKTFIETRSIGTFMLMVSLSLATGYFYYWYFERPMVSSTYKFFGTTTAY